MCVAPKAGLRCSGRWGLLAFLWLVVPAPLWAQGPAGMSGADEAAQVMATAEVVYETAVQMPCSRGTWEALLEAPEVAGALWNAYGYGPAYEVSLDRGDTVHVRDPTGLQGDAVLVEHGADLRRYLVHGRVDHWAVPFMNEGLAVFSLRHQAAPAGQVLATLTVHVKAQSQVAGYLLSLGEPLLRRHVANRIELNLRDAQQLVVAVEQRPEEVRQKAGEATAAKLRAALGH